MKRNDLADLGILRRVAVLCARAESVYHSIPGVDVYCQHRDAFTFTGSCPVVCHPPCRKWGRLRQFVRGSIEEDFERYLARFCVDQIRRFGGVLEHPASSTLWRDQGLPLPGEYSPEGCTVAFPQYWFGHRGLKASWFFVANLQLPEIPPIPLKLESPGVVGVVSMSRREREHTPIDLARWLVDLAILSGSRDRYHWTGRESISPRTKRKDRAGLEMKKRLAGNLERQLTLAF